MNINSWSPDEKARLIGRGARRRRMTHLIDFAVVLFGVAALVAFAVAVLGG